MTPSDPELLEQARQTLSEYDADQEMPQMKDSEVLIWWAEQEALGLFEDDANNIVTGSLSWLRSPDFDKLEERPRADYMIAIAHDVNGYISSLVQVQQALMYAWNLHRQGR